LDEAFLDVSGSVHLFGDAPALARELKRRVYAETELCVSVGVAPSKLVAKIACNLGKPDGLYVVPEAGVRELLEPLDIGVLWGVGPVLERRLRAAGIATFGELARHDTEALSPLLGRRVHELQALARGEDQREVEADRVPKSIGEENTFENDVASAPRIVEVLRVHADAVARRLRRAGYRGRTVSVKIKLAHADPARASERGPHYPLLTRSRTLPEPTDDAEQIGAVARELWASAALTVPIRLLGVSVSALGAVGAGPQQLALFDAAAARGRPAEFAPMAPSSRRPLGPTLDAITERFGAGAIQRAVAAPGKVTHGRGLKRGDN
jgi:DNA polymerase-4